MVFFIFFWLIYNYNRLLFNINLRQLNLIIDINGITFAVNLDYFIHCAFYLRIILVHFLIHLFDHVAFFVFYIQQLLILQIIYPEKALCEFRRVVKQGLFKDLSLFIPDLLCVNPSLYTFSDYFLHYRLIITHTVPLPDLKPEFFHASLDDIDDGGDFIASLKYRCDAACVPFRNYFRVILIDLFYL